MRIVVGDRHLEVDWPELGFPVMGWSASGPTLTSSWSSMPSRRARGCTKRPRSRRRSRTGRAGWSGSRPGPSVRSRSGAGRRWYWPALEPRAGWRSGWGCTGTRDDPWAWRCAATTAARAVEMSTSRRSAPGADPPNVLMTWLNDLPAEWGLREENALSDIDGAGLPMGFSRTPLHSRAAPAPAAASSARELPGQALDGPDRTARRRPRRPRRQRADQADAGPEMNGPATTAGRSMSAGRSCRTGAAAALPNLQGWRGLPTITGGQADGIAGR